MSKVLAKKAQKKDALYNAAFDLFTRKDDSDTSISDIAKKAGVGKGTFYLYFKDKYDIKNKLVARKAHSIIQKAGEALAAADIPGLEDKLIFLVDNVIDQLSGNPALLRFISKNLSWGIFKNAMTEENGEIDENYTYVLDLLMENAKETHTDPDILIYLIVELVGSSIYGSILYSEPVPIAELKPHLFNTIRLLTRAKEK